MSSDWDNLIILDACRYDTFEKINYLDGSLEKRKSLGSDSWDFMRRSFEEKEYLDTVYISMNPHSSKLSDAIFHNHNLIVENPDGGNPLVDPEIGIQALENAIDEYPNKRIILHLMQPHYPYIGEYGDEIRKKYKGDRNYRKLNYAWTMRALRHSDSNLTEQEAITAYEDNLSFVLGKIEPELDNLPGKTVITSDHGEFFGEPLSPIPVKFYGHRSNLYANKLVDVPWFVPPYESRKKITADPPNLTESLSPSQVNEQLEALGYK